MQYSKISAGENNIQTNIIGMTKKNALQNSVKSVADYNAESGNTELSVEHDDANQPNWQTTCSLNMLACHQCGKLWKGAVVGEHCAHCNAILHKRKPDSINRTWALLIAAFIMYIPANMMPVMVTSTFFESHEDTILSGIIFFWISGEWGLAAVVFIASFLVPLLKLASLLILLLTAQKNSDWRRLERAKLYRMVELIGRWSMLDVFVVSLLVGLVQLKGFAQINAGVGIVAFGAVVVLTMLASLSFDPRLIWDTTHLSEIDAQNPLDHQQHTDEPLSAKESHI